MSDGRSGNCLSFLVRETILIAFLLLGVATSAFAQHFAVGLKTGVPLTGIVPTTDYSSGYTFQAQTKDYTLGLVLDISLEGELGIELGAMYKRIDQQGPLVSIVGYTCLDTSVPGCDEGPYAIPKTQFVFKAGRSWEFPVAVQYHMPLHLLHLMQPYVEGGLSYNHLSDVLASPFPGPGYYVPYPRPQEVPRVVFSPAVYSVNRTGYFAGGGVDIKLRGIHLTPGLRYTRYDKVTSFLPSPNAVDVLVKFHLIKF